MIIANVIATFAGRFERAFHFMWSDDAGVMEPTTHLGKLCRCIDIDPRMGVRFEMVASVMQIAYCKPYSRFGASTRTRKLLIYQTFIQHL